MIPTSPSPSPSRKLPAVLVLAGALAALGLHVRVYFPFLTDDALISLRYAQRLLDGHGLTWTGTERVEGYSNLLWVLACAALGWLGMDLIHAAWALGAVATTAAFAAVVWTFPPHDARSALPALAGTCALAASGTIAVWTFAGLETAMMVGLLAWALALALPLAEAGEQPRRGWALPGSLLGLLCLTRPDGVLFTAGVTLGLLAARRDLAGLRLALRLAVLPAAFLTAQLAFRLGYYGEWVPNTALVKLALTPQRLLGGLRFVGLGALFHLGLLVLAAAAVRAAIRDEGVRRRAVLLGLPTLLWGVYLVAIGGDVFAGRRLFAPVVLGLAMLGALGLQARLGPAGPGTRRLAVQAGLLLALVAGAQQLDAYNRMAREERWEWDGAILGRFLQRAFGPSQPLLAVDTAGCLPYFSQLPALDMLGLTDRYLARHPPAGFGKGLIGHELGDGDYVLRREPDLIVLCSPYGLPYGCYPSGRMMQRRARFWREYRQVRFLAAEAGRTVGMLAWLRLQGRLGIERAPGRVRIPGHLFCNLPGSRAQLDSSGRLGMPVRPGRPVQLAGLPLEPGDWWLEVEAEAPAKIAVRLSGGTVVVSEPGAALRLSVPASVLPGVDLVEISTDGAAAMFLYGAALRRIEPGATQVDAALPMPDAP
jgi:arabinofuranosyltransferase